MAVLCSVDLAQQRLGCLGKSGSRGPQAMQYGHERASVPGTSNGNPRGGATADRAGERLPAIGRSTSAGANGDQVWHGRLREARRGPQNVFCFHEVRGCMCPKTVTRRSQSGTLPGVRAIFNAGIEYGMLRRHGSAAQNHRRGADELLERAQRAGNTGITQTARAGLQLVAASQAYAQLRQLRGKVRFSRTLDELKADR